MEKEFKFEITSNDSIIVDFDNDPKHIAKYEIRTAPEPPDKVILILNREACRAFARLFAQLAVNDYEEGYHFHLCLTEKQTIHRGLRIVLDKDGRLNNG